MQSMGFHMLQYSFSGRGTVNTVIVGKPNVGKSSLMNFLTEEESAIVTEIAGTTRDVLRETVIIFSITGSFPSDTFSGNTSRNKPITSSSMTTPVDVCVVGAGHAGCEAALACARLGLETVIFTVSIDSIALMPCNPNIGGTSKGHLVRELDALGGEMGKNIDRTFIQSKMLNVSKGPAVHSLRAPGKGSFTSGMTGSYHTYIYILILTVHFQPP